MFRKSTPIVRVSRSWQVFDRLTNDRNVTGRRLGQVGQPRVRWRCSGPLLQVLQQPGRWVRTRTDRGECRPPSANTPHKGSLDL